MIDIGGREVRGLRRGYLEPGQHELTWDGRDDAGLATPAGAYFVAVVTDEVARTMRLVRLQ